MNKNGLAHCMGSCYTCQGRAVPANMLAPSCAHVFSQCPARWPRRRSLAAVRRGGRLGTLPAARRAGPHSPHNACSACKTLAQHEARETVCSACRSCHGVQPALVEGARDGGDAVDELGAEDDVGITKHALLQADHDELGVGEVRPDHAPNVLRVAQVQRSVHLGHIKSPLMRALSGKSSNEPQALCWVGTAIAREEQHVGGRHACTVS